MPADVQPGCCEGREGVNAVDPWDYIKDAPIEWGPEWRRDPAAYTRHCVRLRRKTVLTRVAVCVAIVALILAAIICVWALPLHLYGR
jgi:hypothetical protein